MYALSGKNWFSLGKLLKTNGQGDHANCLSMFVFSLFVEDT